MIQQIFKSNSPQNSVLHTLQRKRVSFMSIASFLGTQPHFLGYDTLTTGIRDACFNATRPPKPTQKNHPTPSFSIKAPEPEACPTRASERNSDLSHRYPEVRGLVVHGEENLPPVLA